MKKLNAKQLRKSDPSKEDLENIKRTPIYLVLDRIIDTYNIGSLFRLADAIAVEKVYLCGDMEYPPSSRIHKAAVGTENWVPWEKTESTLEAIHKLKTMRHPDNPKVGYPFISGSPSKQILKQVQNDNKDVQIIAVEQSEKSTDYSLLSTENVKFPVAIIAGNETKGLPKEVLNEVDLIVELPMLGVNRSFNVWGSTAVVAYKILELLK